MEDVPMAMVDDKPFVHELLDRVLDFNLRVIDNVCSCDIDAMIFGDDWGMQTGLIMGHKAWSEFIESRTRQMYDRVKSRGKLVFIHCCGKVVGRDGGCPAAPSHAIPPDAKPETSRR